MSETKTLEMMLSNSIIHFMKDIIAKNLLVGRICVKCSHFISTSSDSNVFTPHCTLRDVHPIENTCHLWAELKTQNDEFTQMRETLKRYKEEI